MPFVLPALAAIGGGSALAGGALVASTAAGIYGASQNSKAIKSASAAQQASGQAAIDEQRRQFDITHGDLSPWLQAGQTALNQRMLLLGLGGLPGFGGASSGALPPGINPNGGGMAGAGGIDYARIAQERPDVVQEYQRLAASADPNSPWYSQHGLDRGLNGYIDSWLGSKPAEDTYQAPMLGGAPGGVTTGGAIPGQDPGQAQAAAIEALKNSPLYQSLYRNGAETVLQNASATGGLRGGNIQRSLADFGSDTLATVIERQLSQLSGLSDNGQNAGTNLGTLGANTSGNISNLIVQQGAAKAGGILGQAAAGQQGLSALLSGIGRGVGSYTGMQQMNGLF